MVQAEQLSFNGSIDLSMDYRDHELQLENMAQAILPESSSWAVPLRWGWRLWRSRVGGCMCFSSVL